MKCMSHFLDTSTRTKIIRFSLYLKIRKGVGDLRRPSCCNLVGILSRRSVRYHKVAATSCAICEALLLEMHDARTLLVLRATRRSRQRAFEALQELRRRLIEEVQRAEHARIVRIRHYLTKPCLLDPAESAWMRIWTRGNDEAFLATTSLCRYTGSISYFEQALALTLV